MTDPIHVCKLCDHPVRLADILDGFGEVWEHCDAAIQHAPIPVPVGEETCCSLCGLPLGDGGIQMHAGAFVVDFPDGPLEVSEDTWPLCVPCAECVVLKQPEKTIERALNVMAAVVGAPIPRDSIAATIALHDGFHQHWIRQGEQP